MEQKLFLEKEEVEVIKVVVVSFPDKKTNQPVKFKKVHFFRDDELHTATMSIEKEIKVGRQILNFEAVVSKLKVK